MGIGTVSSADLMPSPSKRSVMFAQSEYEDGLARTIVVTPPRSLNHDSILAEDESHRNRAINLRHLQDMIRRRTPELARVARILSTPELRLDSSREFASGLHESVWSFDGIHRVAVTALGLMGADEELTPEMIEKALQILDASDAVKYVWATEERHGQREQKQVLGDMLDSPSPLSSKNLSDDKLKRIRKDCNAHEKKLLGGVINPGLSYNLYQPRIFPLTLTTAHRKHQDHLCRRQSTAGDHRSTQDSDFAFSHPSRSFLVWRACHRQDSRAAPLRSTRDGQDLARQGRGQGEQCHNA